MILTSLQSKRFSLNNRKYKSQSKNYLKMQREGLETLLSEYLLNVSFNNQILEVKIKIKDSRYKL